MSACGMCLVAKGCVPVVWWFCLAKASGLTACWSLKWSIIATEKTLRKPYLIYDPTLQVDNRWHTDGMKCHHWSNVGCPPRQLPTEPTVWIFGFMLGSGSSIFYPRFTICRETCPHLWCLQIGGPFDFGGLILAKLSGATHVTDPTKIHWVWFGQPLWQVAALAKPLRGGTLEIAADSAGFSNLGGRSWQYLSAWITYWKILEGRPLDSSECFWIMTILRSVARFQSLGQNLPILHKDT